MTTASFPKTLIISCFCSLLQSAVAQKGYDIKVKLDNYAAKTLVLGYHMADKQYIRDSTTVGADGLFTFKGDTLLPCGVYLLVLKPDNNLIQVLLPDGDQTLTLTADAKDPANSVKIKGSEDNIAFYEYTNFLSGLKPEADSIGAQLSRLKNKPADSLRLTARLVGMDKRVKKYQADFVAKHPTFLSTKIIRAVNDPESKKYVGQYSVKIVSVCTAVTEKAAECWKSAQEKEFSDILFMNLYDPYIQSRYKTLYDVQTTPQIFILNRQHEIIMKRIDAEQLDGVMQQILNPKTQK